MIERAPCTDHAVSVCLLPALLVSISMHYCWGDQIIQISQRLIEQVAGGSSHMLAARSAMQGSPSQAEVHALSLLGLVARVN